MERFERLLAGAPWGLVTFRDQRDDVRRAGILTPDGVEVPTSIDGHPGLESTLAVWDEVEPALHGFTPAGAARTDVVIEAPLRRPGKLLCAGANFLDHVQEMGIEDVPPGIRPFFFLLPTSSIVGPGVAVRIPPDDTARVDWEAELGVVIGRRARNVRAADAIDHVAAYGVVNDVSARGLHRRPDPLAPPFEFDWLTSKGLDTFTPFGPVLVPAWLAPDPADMHIRLWQNDELRQDGTTRSMIADVAELISAASHLMTLEPGDLIATGTPPGVGAPRGLQVVDGDHLVASIAGVGTLDSPIVADPEQRPAGWRPGGQA